MISKKASDSIFILIPGWISRLKGVLFLPLIIKSIGLENYGAYIQIIANVTILVPFTHLAMGQATLRFGSKLSDTDREGLREAFWVPFLFCGISSVILGLFYILLAPIISHTFLRGLQLGSLYVAAPLIFANGANLIFLPYINSRKRFKEAGVFRLLQELLPYLALVAGVYWTQDLRKGLICSVAASCLLIFIMMIRIAGEVGMPCFRPAVFKKYLRFSWPIAAMTFTQANQESIPRYIIPLFMGPAALGIFNIMYMISRLLNTFNEPFLKYLNSFLPKIWDQGDRTYATHMIERCSLYYIVAAICAATLIVAGFEDVVRLIMPTVNTGVVSHLEATLIGLCLAALFYGLNELAWVAAKLDNKSMIILIGSIIGFIVSIVLTYVLTRFFGLFGTAAAQMLSVVAIQYFFVKILPIKRSKSFLISLAKVSLPTTLMGLAVILIPKADIWSLLVSMFIGIIVFVLSVFVLKVVTFEEFANLVLDRGLAKVKA
ncbi:MAG: hypothetical protein COT35_01425 [Nitrospirae bacterium CG08_land_8_20_14_0_20_52_24]|nr:MAG: hypothetical protein COT35_01425 [Nitrospirae bacterium CG08_land_8_20_14_0_20_52_24]